jgi:hypothetical protein
MRPIRVKVAGLATVASLAGVVSANELEVTLVMLVLFVASAAVWLKWSMRES